MATLAWPKLSGATTTDGSSHLCLWFGPKRSEMRSLGHKQVLTAMLGRFWSSDEDEIGPEGVSGVLLVGRTPNWQSLKMFG